MGRPRKETLRTLQPEERKELTRVTKATSERLDAVDRGATLTEAGQEAA